MSASATQGGHNNNVETNKLNNYLSLKYWRIIVVVIH